MLGKTIIVDIDDTLLIYCKKEFANWHDKYESAIPDYSEIEMLNRVYDNGATVILWTGRNWDKYDYTVNQLDKLGIKYHQLLMGKPQGVYVDRDAVKSLEDICC